MIPRDQISTFPSYWPSSMARMTSGAIQYGVPTKELAGQANEADPKSAETEKYIDKVNYYEAIPVPILNTHKYSNHFIC